MDEVKAINSLQQLHIPDHISSQFLRLGNGGSGSSSSNDGSGGDGDNRLDTASDGVIWLSSVDGKK